MSHRSQRKGSRQQKQQKLQLQEHLPRQRVQRRRREQRDQRQWQERRAERGRREERREEQREERERERSREAVQETIDNMYKENQTDLPQPFRQEPQVERFPEPHREQLSEPPREQLPEPQVEHIQEPRVQRLPPLSNFKFWVWLLSLGFCLGYWIGRAVARRAPRATEAFHLAIRVFALEVGRFAFSSLNQLARSLAHVVSTYGGFWEFVVLLVMLTMYLAREEPAGDNPHRDGNVADESSDDEFYSLDGVWTNGNTPEEPWVLEPDSDSDSISEDVVARDA